MEKKNLDWANIGFEYVQTDKRYVANYKDGKWDEGTLTEDANIVMNECAGVLQYAQTVFEGMKAYTTEDGRIVTFRPDLNAARMVDSAKRLEMPVFPEDRFVDAIVQTVQANAAYVPPYGSGASLYIRPYMFGINPVIGVKPADEYQFRVFTTPVGPYFKGGAKPITICVSDFDRAAPHGTGHIKAGLNYAMSLHAIVTAHANGFDENMYLDSATRTKVEETGGANFIFVTPLTSISMIGLIFRFRDKNNTPPKIATAPISSDSFIVFKSGSPVPKKESNMIVAAADTINPREAAFNPLSVSKI